MTKEEIDAFDVDRLTPDQKTGYIIECDITYPKRLHFSHNSFPAAPLSQEINEELLSPTSRKCYEQIYGKEKYSARKLCGHFMKRRRYCTHYRNLIVYKKLGLKVSRIRRILSFDQSAYLKPYIEKCTFLRQQAKTDFGKRLFKLFVNR